MPTQWGIQLANDGCASVDTLGPNNGEKGERNGVLSCIHGEIDGRLGI